MSIFLAFLAGGFICLIAQLLIDFTKLTPARILVFYVCFGVFLSAVGIFDILRNIFGCGVTVPLIGFGANIAEGVKKTVESEGIKGILSGPLSNCAGGICFTLICAFLVSLIFKSKSKRL